MLNASTTHDCPTSFNVPEVNLTQKVVIVNGNADILDLFDTAFDEGHYNVVFVESTEHAYSRIKSVRPQLVILCMQLDELDGFHVLSMLKLDEETRDIPVLTCTTEFEARQVERQQNEASETELGPAKSAARMN